MSGNAYIVIVFIIGLVAGAGGYVWVQRQFKALVRSIADGLRERLREIAASEVERIRKQEDAPEPEPGPEPDEAFVTKVSLDRSSDKIPMRPPTALPNRPRLPSLEEVEAERELEAVDVETVLLRRANRLLPRGYAIVRGALYGYDLHFMESVVHTSILVSVAFHEAWKRQTLYPSMKRAVDSIGAELREDEHRAVLAESERLLAETLAVLKDLESRP